MGKIDHSSRDSRQAMPRFSDRPRVGDWLPFRCGDRIREIGGRHVARVRAVFHGAYVAAQWEETGWFSEFAFAEVEHAPDDE